MKIVIQCCATKNRAGGGFTSDGRPVKFVPDSKSYPVSGAEICFHPDDLMPSTSKTWREHLHAYNSHGGNPNHLLQAGALYSLPAYRQLFRADAVGPENLYILSAGWGLVRSDFFLPDYDITFSQQAARWKRRMKNAVFHDFAHLTQACLASDETVYFFGGTDYLPLYYRLMRGLVARKIIYFKAAKFPRDNAFEYIRYECHKSRNWHYDCVTDFLASSIER